MRDRSESVHQDEEREYELVLGNKQLLSVMFLVVVLLGVFFAMGYVMGRNTAPTETARNASDRDDTPVIPRRTITAENAPTQQPNTAEPGQTPAAQIPAPESGTEKGAADAEESKPAARTPDDPPPTVNEPQAGQTYLQVSAVAKPEAELLVEVLTKKGFNAMIAPGPTDKLFRVLVGPAKDQAGLAKMKGDLEQAGFKTMPRRY